MSTQEIYRRPKTSILATLHSLNKDAILPIVKDPLTLVLNHRAKLWVDMVDSKVVEHTLDILKLTKVVKPETTNNINKIISELNTYKLVFDENGNWSYINKINTNYTDYSVLLADLLDECESTDLNKIYREIKTYPRPQTHLLAEFVSKLPKNAEYIWDKFLCDEEKYTQNIRKNSAEGEIVEENVIKKLIDSGYEIIHRGGNGDFIDMKLGVDIITKKENTYSYIQVKKCASIDEVELKGKRYIKINGVASSKINTQYVDEIAYGTLDGKIFIGGRKYYFNIDNNKVTDRFFGLPLVTKANQYTILSEIIND